MAQAARRAERTTWDNSPQPGARAEVLLRRMGLIADNIDPDDVDDDYLVRMGLARDDTNYRRGVARAEAKTMMNKASLLAGPARGSVAYAPSSGTPANAAAFRRR